MAGKTVVVVDDGIATGATAIATLRALRGLVPAKLVLAVPGCPVDTLQRLTREADEFVCLATPDPFPAVGVC
ncbi:MAG: phosphoribosyltransferase family protein [Rhizobiaceae bacterium]